jgi:hypothetical protein
MHARICGKRTARFLCTLDAGHSGPHGRRYRRDARAERGLRETGAKCDNCGAPAVTHVDSGNRDIGRVAACARCAEGR